MFKDIFNQYNWDTVQQSIYAKTTADVENAINKTKRDIEDFKALISPAAAPYLEQMAQLSHAITLKRFGKTIQLYAPLYLSNECQNICNYCGFSLDNKIKRKTLAPIEIIQEAQYLKAQGFDHVLLVTGEANQTVGLDYLKNAIKLLRPIFANISIEVQPMDEEDYAVLAAEGLYAVLVYQETYHKANYKNYHTKGRKSNFDYRLDTPDRLGKAAIHKTGLGVLIGLEDWRTDNFFTALHVNYLEKQYWQTRYSISFPRLRPAEGILEPNVVITDKELVQLICAWRIFNEEIEISISTRESEDFRNHIIKLGATTMSAGSKTNPGGYTIEEESLEQFEINDHRTVAQVEHKIKATGYKPVWKDWAQFAIKHVNLLAIIIALFLVASCKKDTLHLQKVQQIATNTTANLYNIKFINDSVCLVTGGTIWDNAVILRSVDGGNIFTTPNYPYVNVGMVGCTMANDGALYLCGSNSVVMYSKDSGVSWNSKHLNDYLFYVGVAFPNPDTGIFVITHLQEDGTVIEVDKNLNIRKQTKYKFGLNNIYMPNAATGYIIGYGAVLKTTDGRQTWNYQNVSGDNFMAMDIHGEQIWMCGYNGSVYHTINGGNNWDVLRNGNNITIPKYHLLNILFKDNENGWAVCDDGKLIHTDDGGNHWAEYDQFTTNTLRSLALCPNGDLLVAGDNGVLYRITVL